MQNEGLVFLILVAVIFLDDQGLLGGAHSASACSFIDVDEGELCDTFEDDVDQLDVEAVRQHVVNWCHLGLWLFFFSSSLSDTLLPVFTRYLLSKKLFNLNLTVFVV